MTTLFDMLDERALADALEHKYVNRQTHPTEPLVIYNYSDQAQFDRQWNDVTLACRGLVVDERTNEVLARPFRKFFNYGQPEAPADPGGPIVVADKADGSMGVLYTEPVSGLPAIATRGSFASPQAQHATELYRERYHGRWEPNSSWTYLFEIIFPDNRIVVDYAGMDDLILLGAVDVATGRSLTVEQARGNWPGPVVETFPYATLTQAIAAPDRDNREGFVVHFLDTDERVKLKQAEYLRLHSLLTECSARTIWQHVVVGACGALIEEPMHWGTYLHMDPRDAVAIAEHGQDWKAALLDNVPDEFYSWVTSTIDGLYTKQAKLYDEALAFLAEGVAKVGDDPRRLFEHLSTHVWQKELMRHHKGQTQFLVLRSWSDVEPGHILPFADRANG